VALGREMMTDSDDECMINSVGINDSKEHYSALVIADLTKLARRNNIKNGGHTLLMMKQGKG
jgi:hypothetical protein